MAPYKRPRMNSNMPTQDLLCEVDLARRAPRLPDGQVDGEKMIAAVVNGVRDAIQGKFEEFEASLLNARETREDLLAFEHASDAYYRSEEKKLEELQHSIKFLIKKTEGIAAHSVQCVHLSEESPLYPQVEKLRDYFAKAKAKWDKICLSQEYES